MGSQRGGHDWATFTVFTLIAGFRLAVLVLAPVFPGIPVAAPVSSWVSDRFPHEVQDRHQLPCNTVPTLGFPHNSLAHAARRAPVWGDAPRCWVTLGVRGSDITPRMRKLPSSGKAGREAEKVSTKTLFASLIFPPPRPRPSDHAPWPRPSWPRPRARRLVGIVVPGPLSPPQQGRRGLRRSKPRNWTAEGLLHSPASCASSAKEAGPRGHPKQGGAGARNGAPCHPTCRPRSPASFRSAKCCASALSLHSPEGPGFGLSVRKIGLSSGPSSCCKQGLLSETGHLRSPYLQAQGPRPTYKLPCSHGCRVKLPHMNLL